MGELNENGEKIKDLEGAEAKAEADMQDYAHGQDQKERDMESNQNRVEGQVKMEGEMSAREAQQLAQNGEDAGHNVGRNVDQEVTICTKQFEIILSLLEGDS